MRAEAMSRQRCLPSLAALRRLARAGALLLALGLASALPSLASEITEYRLKAAFLFNFAGFTEWPVEVGSTLNLCIYGTDPFGAEIDPLQGRVVAARAIAVHRRATLEALKGCQIVYVAPSAAGQLPRVAETLREQPALIVADTAGALRRGAMLNMNLQGERVTFEANLVAARTAKLGLSSRLLRLATEVIQ